MTFNKVVPLLFSFVLLGYAAMTQVVTSVEDLPGAFLIGDHQEPYEKLIEQNSSRLLTACDNSMDEAYGHWMEMLKAMEDYSDKVNFDLKGIKIWINVFWTKDGSINHIVYYPKPNCRNMEFEELTQFFDSFKQQYVIPVNFVSGYSHFGTASFPTFYRSSKMDVRN